MGVQRDTRSCNGSHERLIHVEALAHAMRRLRVLPMYVPSPGTEIVEFGVGTAPTL